jgi:hypothetical protein
VVKYKSDDAAVWREGDLAGHLPAEQADKARPDAKVVTGDKAPDYMPIDKVPTDPRGKADFALEVAFKELKAKLQ